VESGLALDLKCMIPEFEAGFADEVGKLGEIRGDELKAEVLEGDMHHPAGTDRNRPEIGVAGKNGVLLQGVAPSLVLRNILDLRRYVCNTIPDSFRRLVNLTSRMDQIGVTAYSAD